jgi:DNA-binding XRE family transcriptional regulator
MLTTGNQLRAARALADMDQRTLARKAGVNINTIGAMEKRRGEVLTSGLDTIQAVMHVLEAAGVQFLNDGKPGVRFVGTSLVEPVSDADRSETVQYPEFLDGDGGPGSGG